MPLIQEVLNSYRQNVPAEPSTMSRREQVYRRLSGVVSLDVAEAKVIDLLSAVNAIPTWSTGTKDLAVRAVNSGLNWGVKVGLIQSNPFAKIEMPKEEQGRAWTEDEYQRAVKTAAGNWKLLRFSEFMSFMRVTGARPGEVASLEWSMLQGNKFVLERHKTRRKTRKPRIIPLLPGSEAVLKWRPKYNARCFTTDRAAFWTPDKLGRKMKATRQLAGLPDDCFLHGIRHLFATDFVKRGGNIAVLSKILGHASIETTIRCYVHLDDDDVDMMLAAMKGLK